MLISVILGGMWKWVTLCRTFSAFYHSGKLWNFILPPVSIVIIGQLIDKSREIGVMAVLNILANDIISNIISLFYR